MQFSMMDMKEDWEVHVMEKLHYLEPLSIA